MLHGGPMKIVITLTVLLLSTSFLNAQEIPTIKSEKTYSCSSDLRGITGTDGTYRSCWPYVCNGSSMCTVMCATSQDCQSDAACGRDGICIKQ